MAEAIALFEKSYKEEITALIQARAGKEFTTNHKSIAFFIANEAKLLNMS